MITEFTKNLHSVMTKASTRTAPPKNVQQKIIETRPSVSPKPVNRFTGNKDQFDGISAGAEICDVVIGLDFGTACTKVIIRTPYHFNSASFVVPFGEYAHHSNEHLLPTHIGINENQYYLPGKVKPAQFSNLKMKLIESLTSMNTDEDSDNAIAYLALLFRHIRSWFIQNQHGAYSDFKLVWQVNVGVPSASAECDELCNLYQKTIYTAWELSLLNSSITHPAVLSHRELLYSGQSKELEVVITVFPEVAAEVAGYTQSDFRQDGLHVLIDVGAGTLDVCGFNVHRKNGDNVLPIFSTSVERLGVSLLHESRRKALEQSLKEKLDALMPDPATPLTCKNSEYTLDNKSCLNAVDISDTVFFKACIQQINSVVHHLKTSMDPNSQRWKDQLPVFLCGGGKALPQYQGLVESLSKWLKTNVGGCQARLIDLPRPAQLKGNIHDNDYHRFAVAWGLSHPSDDIDRVITNVEPILLASKKTAGTPWYLRRRDYSLDDY